MRPTSTYSPDDRSFDRKLPGWLLVALAAAMLLWPAVVNGRPPVFTDTALYYSEAEYLFEALGVIGPGEAVEPPNDPTALPSTPGAPNISAAIDGARSPLYGAPVYVLQRIGGLWLVAAVQAAGLAGVILLLHRAAAPRAPNWGFLAVVAALATLSPLPFFAGFIMPDVWAGAAACGLILLLIYPDRLSRSGLAGALAVTGYGLAVHRSNLLVAVAAIAVTAILLRFTGLGWRRIAGRAAMAMAAAAGGLAVTSLLYLPIHARAGERIGTPPFLSARLLADGPGRDYLRHVCHGARGPYALCAFQGRPMATSNQVLWSNKRRSAVFLAAGPAGRLRMEDEDASFAAAAAAFEPGREAKAALSDSLRQFAMVHVDDPLRPQRFYVADGYWRLTALPRILPDEAACRPKGACQPLVRPAISRALEDAGLILAVLILAWRLGAPDMRELLLPRRPPHTRAPSSISPGLVPGVQNAALSSRGAALWMPGTSPGKTEGANRPASSDDRVRLLILLALVLTVLVANAVVCGALSGPFPRYQARVIWLVPLGAGLVVAGLNWRRKAPARD